MPAVNAMPAVASSCVDIIGPGAIGLHLALALPLSMQVRLRHPDFYHDPMADVTDADTGYSRPVTLLPLADPSPIHLAIVTTKSFQVSAALAAVSEAWAPQAEVLLFTNGLGPQERAANVLPSDVALWVGVTTEGALRTDRLSRRHTGSGETTLGPWVGFAEPGQLSRLLDRSSLQTRWLRDSSEVRTRVWQKLIVNLAINPLTAEQNLANGALSHPDLKRIWLALVEEAVQVAQAEGLTLTTTELRDQITSVITATAQNYSSMHQDVHHQRRTEADDIIGVLARLALAHKLQTPNLERLWERFQDQFA